jgi:hypothetical protein
MLIAALVFALQVTPLPDASPTAVPPTAIPSTDTSWPADCIPVEPNPCPLDTQKRPAESACVRGAQADERCARQTTGFMHYARLMRAGTRWGVTAAWYGRKTPRGRVYVESARRIFVQVAHDPNAPGSMSDVARSTLVKIYGTDRPTATTPFLADRRRT